MNTFVYIYTNALMLPLHHTTNAGATDEDRTRLKPDRQSGTLTRMRPWHLLW